MAAEWTAVAVALVAGAVLLLLFLFRRGGNAASQVSPARPAVAAPPVPARDRHADPAPKAASAAAKTAPRGPRADPPLLASTLKGHTDAITHLVFCPDGKTLATASADRSVRLWEVATLAHKTRPPPTRVALDADHGTKVQ